MPKSSTLIKRDADFISLNMNKVALVKAMRSHGLTATKVIKPIVDALQAKKLITHGKDENAWTEEEVDHATRLRAAQLAIELLGLKNSSLPDIPAKTEASKLLTDALNSGDEIRLQQIVFNKNQEPNKQVTKKEV